MKYFPNFQFNPIERPDELKEPATEHPSQEANRLARQKNDEFFASIRNACGALKGTCPEAWSNFERGLQGLYQKANALDSRNPLEYIGGGVPAEYYALMKAYTSGQREILEAIFSVAQIQPDHKTEPVPVKKSFFSKLLDILRGI